VVGLALTVKLRILTNIAIDFLGGLVPIVGDIFDAFFKANIRNTRILREHLTNRQKNRTESH
ncbi:DUF4112 domain-containing protein, partial [Gilvimarinus agarilyticus]|nr:DUF4112 domain-containing protein [Gilvimarinus agarilyticus]